MKKILFLFFTVLAIACSAPKYSIGDVSFGTSMRNVYEKVFTQAQFDSICDADTLPKNFSKWHSNTYRDFESGEVIKEYLFIKKLGVQQDIYRVERRSNDYKITKRITK